MDHLLRQDPAMAQLLRKELLREEAELNLIASENYTPQSIMEATGSILTNKYAEGYPGKRYYGGCQVIDEVEQLAIDRAKELFQAEHANVQPHAGSQANMAVYAALLQPGDTIMGMSLAAGGHLTHGHPVNFSGSIYKSVQYGVNKETECLDYQEIERIAHEHQPKLIIAGASAYSRYIDFAQFSKIAQSIGAYFLADIAHIAGPIAAGLHQSPVLYADAVTSTTHKTLRGPRGGFILAKDNLKDKIDKSIIPGLQGGPLMHAIGAKATCFKLAQEDSFKHYQMQVLANAKALAKEFTSKHYRIVAGGTDNHLFILDLRTHNITGRAAEVALQKAGISCSRSCIPFDPEKPWITSGIRLGTPAITTRGMKEQEMTIIANYIDEALRNAAHDEKLLNIKEKVLLLCNNFPLYN